jgi:hypothetical protein
MPIAALVLALGGCGGGSATPSPTPSATAAATPTVPTPAGPRLRGTDYTLVLANGWVDTTSGHTSGAAVDRVFSIQHPHATTVVARVAATAGASAAKLLAARAKSELAGAHATAHTRARTLTLDGAPAITYAYRGTSPGGAKIEARQVLALHGRSLHVITLVAGTADFAGADVTLGSMLATWRWA